MQTKNVPQLPPCTECQATDVNPPREAEFEVITPMKMKARLCATHFMDYVESRLGTGTVAQLVLVRKAGGK
jgi:hypothetical protein